MSIFSIIANTFSVNKTMLSASEMQLLASINASARTLKAQLEAKKLGAQRAKVQVKDCYRSNKTLLRTPISTKIARKAPINL